MKKKKEWWKPITQSCMPNPTITNLRYMCKLNLITISETED